MDCLLRHSELYRRALAVNPDLIDAAADLGVIEAESGHLHEAAELWQEAFRRAPGKSALGMNLVTAFCDAAEIRPSALHRAASAGIQSRHARRKKSLAEPESYSSGMFGMSVHGHEHIDSAALSSTKNVLIPGVNCFFFSGSFR